MTAQDREKISRAGHGEHMHFLRRFQAGTGESEEGHWGIIDILTLVLVFFIILYVNEMKDEAVADSAVAQSVTASQPEPLVEPLDISGYFADYTQDGFYLARADQRHVLVLEEKLSFAPGRAELGGDSFAVLDRVAALLAEEQGYDAVISGHTDDVPIGNGEFRSNWHLATFRAVAVAEYLLGKGVGPQRLTTQGFAEFRPLAENDSPGNRRKNRRVEISLRNRGAGGG